MKVAIAYNYDPSNLRGGGGITYVHNLLKELLNKAEEVVLFGCKLSENQTFRHSNLEFIPVLRGTDDWWKFLINLPRRIKSANVRKYYIIHTHHPPTMYPFTRITSDNPKICTFHGVPLDWVKINYRYLHPFVGPVYKFVERRIIENVDAITTAGIYPQMGLKKRYPNLDLDKKYG
ncbi:MAG: glycosyltransferase family 4 protein [Methanomassiliicoccales archaeon]|jgi:hypothetical protein|nr:glycosyltransferase family 4 protein [Methanomassiliicoccales archaeon]